MKRVIVTGASGFLGFALVKRLLAEDLEVFCICRPNSPNLSRLVNYCASSSIIFDFKTLGEKSAVSASAHIIELDIQSYSKLADYIDGPCDVFYHLAWDDGVGVENGHDFNILTSAMAVLAAEKLSCKRFVATGSQAEYGLHDEILLETSELRPVTDYSKAKVASYYLTNQLAIKNGIDHIWARVFSVYGENMNKDTAISYIIQKLKGGETVKLTLCEQIWTYLYEKDLADALYLLGTSENVAGIYNIGHTETKVLKDYFEILADAYCEICECDKDAIHMEYGAKAYKDEEVMHLACNIEKMTRDTSWAPSVNFEDGIKNTIKARI